MKTPIYIQLLELLEERGVGVSVDVEPFFNKIFSNIHDYNAPELLIQELIESAIISSNNEIMGLWQHEYNGNLKWINNDGTKGLNVHLTILGQVHLNQNRSVNWANKKSWAALVISLLSAIFTGWPLLPKNHSDKQVEKLKLHDTIQQMRLQKPKSKIVNPKKEPLDSSRKP